MKILNWAAGISAVILVILFGIAGAVGGERAYAMGQTFAYVIVICVVIIAIWWFVRKNL